MQFVLAHNLEEAELKKDKQFFILPIEDEEFWGMILDLSESNIIPKSISKNLIHIEVYGFSILEKKHLLILKDLVEFLLTEPMVLKMREEQYFSKYRNIYNTDIFMKEIDYLEIVYSLKLLCDLALSLNLIVYSFGD